MSVQAVSNISFGYSCKVKTLFKKGKLPKVKYDFYGEPLSDKNCTVEHLKCVCYGGKTTLDNVVLSTANKNQERGTRPLKEVLNWEDAGRYLEQFRDVVVDGFIGNDYIQGILKTIKELIGG